MSNNNTTQGWDHDNLAPYLVYEENYWVSYENPRSVAEKVKAFRLNYLIFLKFKCFFLFC